MTQASGSAYSQAAFEAGVTRAAVSEANIQEQGGEGSLTVSPPRCFEPKKGAVIL